MLSESVLSVRKELFPQNKTAVSDMPKVNIQKKVQPTDADMVQTSLSFENIYYALSLLERYIFKKQRFKRAILTITESNFCRKFF